MYQITYNAIGFPQAITAMLKVKDILDTKQDDIALAALHQVGTVFQRNFQTEGRTSGHPWPALSQSTQSERERYGFPPDHPILIRYGGLEFATSTFLLTSSKTASYYSADPNGKAVGVTVTSSGNGVTAYAYGEKAANQVGGGPTNVPARPYWFVTNQVMQKAHDGAVDWLADAISKVV